MGNNTELYNKDFFEWTQTTASLLRDHSFEELSVASIAEEIEDLGKRDSREVNSRTRVLLITYSNGSVNRRKGRPPGWPLSVHNALISYKCLNRVQVFGER